MRLFLRFFLAACTALVAAAAEPVVDVFGLDPKFGPAIESTDAAVRAAVRQPDGKLIIGGSFTSINGVPRRNLARLLPNGGVDLTFDPGASANEAVATLALQADGRLLVGGDFTAFAGTKRGHVVRLLPSGLVDNSFDAGAGADAGIVTLVVLPDGQIVVGGNFTRFNNVTRNRVARLSATGALDPNFAAGTGASGVVMAVAAESDGSVLVAGGFVQFEGAIRNGLVRLKPDGSVDSSFHFTTDTDVGAIAVQRDGRILVGSSGFGTAGKLVRINRDGSNDPTFAVGAGPAGGVNSIVIDSTDQITVVGSFISFAGSALSRVARLNRDGALDTAFSPPGVIDRGIAAVVSLPDGSVIIGGDFRTINGVTRTTLARLSTTGVRDASFAPDFRAGAQVNTFATQSDGKLILAGRFTHVDRQQHLRLARLNANGTVDETFTPSVGLADGVPGAVSEVTNVVVQPDGKILLSGFFDRVNGVVRNRLARLDADGSLDPTFDPGAGPDYGIYALALQADGKVLIGGAFTTFGAVNRNHIARLTATGSLDSSFDPGTGTKATNGNSGWVFQIGVASDGSIFVGGGFNQFNDIPRSAIAKLRNDGSVDSGFQPASSGLGSFLSAPDGKLYVGGFAYIDNQPTSLLRLNANGSIDPSFAAVPFGPAGNIGTLALQPDGKILAAQGVNSSSSQTLPGLVRYLSNGQLDENFSLGGFRDASVGLIVIQPNGSLLVAGRRFTDDITEKFGLASLSHTQAPVVKTAASLTFAAGAPGAVSIDADAVPAAQFRITSGTLPSWAALNPSSGTIFGRPPSTASGSTEFSVEAVNGVGGAGVTEIAQMSLNVLPAPSFLTEPASTAVGLGGSVTLKGESTNPAVTYRWQHNGIDLPAATGATLARSNFQAFDAGVYTVVLNDGKSSSTSGAAVVAPIVTTKVSGDGIVVGENIRHPNGNVYDQVLLIGAAATITADPGQVTRMSFLDLNDDIVQVEFSGSGALTLNLAGAEGPMLPEKYNQDVRYMRGHASIAIAGADETTNVSVFSVGRGNAVNQLLFKDVFYDGIADIASLAIASGNGHFGGIRAGNASFFAHVGLTGLIAPGVQFDGPIYLHNISAFDAAVPMLVVGPTREFLIAGGDLEQANAAALVVDTVPALTFGAGTTSHGVSLPAQLNLGRFENHGDPITPSPTSAAQ